MLFLTTLNLNKNELQNVVIQNLATDPATGALGQIIFNTTAKKLKQFNGTNWETVGSELAPATGTTLGGVMIPDNGGLTLQADGSLSVTVPTDNNFTTVLKNKLDDIEADAEVNIIETVTVNNTALVPDANRIVKIYTIESAAFTDDSTSTPNSPIKVTLTKGDTTTIVGNIPKVSSSSAGVAPKGAAVSTQSQTTKFLREDGTWAAPSYTNGGDYVKKDGTTAMTGALNLNSHKVTNVTDPTSNQDAATKKYVDDLISGLGTVLDFKGTVNTVGNLPTTGVKVGDVYIVTANSSEYVATAISPSVTWEKFGESIDLSAYLKKSDLATSTGTGTTTAMTQKATTDALALKAPLASPALTGTPTAPTASTGTNTTQLATTAFVQQELTNNEEVFIIEYGTNSAEAATAFDAAVSAGKAIFCKYTNGALCPLMLVAGAGYHFALSTMTSTGALAQTTRLSASVTPGTGIVWSTTAGSVLAPLDSPAFTSTPTAPTATAGTNTTQIATTAFVQTAVSNIVKTVTGTISTSATSATVSFTGTLINAFAKMGTEEVVVDKTINSASVVFSTTAAPSSAITCVVVYY